MGDESEALDMYSDRADFEDDEGFIRPNEEQEYYDDERGKNLVRGHHTMANRQTVRLKKMEDRHLKNTIRFAKRSIEEKGPAARYWQRALRFYEEEYNRRKTKIDT
jgi:hypothetical protein